MKIKLRNTAEDNHGQTYVAWLEDGRYGLTLNLEEKTGRTFGKWSWGLDTLLGKSQWGSGRRHGDNLYLDMGQDWYVTGFKKVLDEAEKVAERKGLITSSVDVVKMAVRSAIAARNITAKVDYKAVPTGAKLTVIVAAGSMRVGEVEKYADRVHTLIWNAMNTIADALESNPDVGSMMKPDIQNADDMLITPTRGGLTFICRAELTFDYLGEDKNKKWNLLHSYIPSSFKKQGITASTVDEVEEIEPQGSTPVKERKQKAE